jgi:Family of unknown function (DUF6098)
VTTLFRADEGTSALTAPPVIDTLAELERITATTEPTYVRYSKGPRHDAREKSIDTESGLELPGLSVNPLTAEAWWTRPAADWLARQVCQYQHLREQNPERRPWIVQGRVVARGPDCEPLLVNVRTIGMLSDRLLDEARQRYAERFDAGHGPEG